MLLSAPRAIAFLSYKVDMPKNEKKQRHLLILGKFRRFVRFSEYVFLN